MSGLLGGGGGEHCVLILTATKNTIASVRHFTVSFIICQLDLVIRSSTDKLRLHALYFLAFLCSSMLLYIGEGIYKQAIYIRMEGVFCVVSRDLK